MSICFWPASKARLLRGVHAQNVFCYHKTIRIFGWKTNSVLSKGRIDFISKKRNVAQSNLKSGPCLLITELVNVLVVLQRSSRQVSIRKGWRANFFVLGFLVPN
jgi:hypothetical protein